MIIKAKDPTDNSINIAVGDVFDLGNGYRITVKMIACTEKDMADQRKMMKKYKTCIKFYKTRCFFWYL